MRHHLSRRIPAQAARGRPSSSISSAVRPPVVRPGVHVLLVGRIGSIRQGESCEQGDALAPALYALGQHDALVAADGRLQPGECLAAFLDDVYVVTTPARAREALDVVTTSIQDRAGVATAQAVLRPQALLNSAKRSGPVTPLKPSGGFSPWARPSATRPTLRHRQTRASGRTCNVRGSSLACVPPHVQITCCAPCLPTSWHRTHAATTTQFGSVCVSFLVSQTTKIPKSLPCDTWRSCRHASADSDSNVRSASLLPRTGLRGPMLCPFCGCIAPRLLRVVTVVWPNSKPDQHPSPFACAPSLQLAPTSPTQDGRVGPCGALSMTACDRPNATCLSLASGARAGSITVLAPVQPAFATPIVAEVLLPALAPPAQALLMRSQSGPRAAAWLGTVPSEAGATMPPDRMLIALRRRLRLPLPVAPGRCGAHGPSCGAAVDVYGDHYAACPPHRPARPASQAI